MAFSKEYLEPELELPDTAFLALDTAPETALVALDTAPDTLFDKLDKNEGADEFVVLMCSIKAH